MWPREEVEKEEEELKSHSKAISSPPPSTAVSKTDDERSIGPASRTEQAFHQWERRYMPLSCLREVFIA